MGERRAAALAVSVLVATLVLVGCGEQERPDAGSEQAALTAMVEDAFPGKHVYEVAFLATGDGKLGSQFVLRTDWRGASMTGSVGAIDGRWRARLDQACAERLAPPYDPLDGWTDATDVMRLDCTSAGTTADHRRVHAGHDGVHVEVDDRTGWDGAALQVGSPGHYAPLGGPPVARAATTPLDLAPGAWLVGCSPGHMTPADQPARITVTAGPDVWRPPLDRVRCGHGGTPDFVDHGVGPTEQAALDDALRLLAPSAQQHATVRLVDDGYWRTPGHGFVVLEPGVDQVHYGRTAPVDGAWAATITETGCPPA